MGAKKRGPVSVPAQPDLIVTVGIAIPHLAAGAVDVNIFMGIDGDPRFVELVKAAEEAGDFRGPVGQIVAVIAKVLGGHRVTATDFGSSSVWGPDGRPIGRA